MGSAALLQQPLQQRAWWDQMWNHMWGPAGSGGWGWMGFMMLFWAIILLLLVWFAAQLLRVQGSNDSRGSRRGGAGDAAEILRERYARGEIDRDTFLRMLDDIRGGSKPQ